MSEGRLERLKSLKAKQRSANAEASSVTSVPTVARPHVPRNPDGTPVTTANGNDSFLPAPGPWEPVWPRDSVYVRVPLLRDVQGSAPGVEAGASWAVSLWNASHRLTYDVTCGVDAVSSEDALTDRVLRLDVLAPGVTALTVRVEIVGTDSRVCAAASLPLLLRPEAHVEQCNVVLSKYKPGGVVTGTASVSLSPHKAEEASLVLFSPADGLPVMVAPFQLTHIQTRVYRPPAAVPSAPCALPCPCDYLLPGRSEVSLTVHSVSGSRDDSYSPLHWPPLSVAAALSRGNGEIVVEPLLLGVCKSGDGGSGTQTPRSLGSRPTADRSTSYGSSFGV